MAIAEDSNAKKRAHHTEYMRGYRLKTGARPRGPTRSAEETKWRKAFYNHRDHAARRGIAFLLTFEEWRTIWIGSGRWELRGSQRGQYVMARTGDMGPYAVGNVRICTVRENNDERIYSEQTRERMSMAQKAAWQEGRRVRHVP